MERIVAVKRLRKLLGKNFAYSINPKAPSAEEREEAKAAKPELETAYRLASEALSIRREFLLSQDAEYQALLVALTLARTAKEENGSKLYAHKIDVGTQNRVAGFGPIFHVEASGDSWEDIFAKLAKKQQAA